MDIRDQFGVAVDIVNLERIEQELANIFIEPNDVVFELGARYGSVSCIINAKLNCKTNQVVVEPDERVWAALERNRAANNCNFYIVKGFVSSKPLALTNLDNWFGGYGATFVDNAESKVPSYTMKEINNKFNLQFNVLVADCEGFLERFFDENPNFCDGLRLIIFEADYEDKCNYSKIRDELRHKGFFPLIEGHQNVWKK